VGPGLIVRARSHYLVVMVDLFIAGVAVLLLVAVTVAVVRSERLTRGRIAAALAVAVLAAGTFAVTLYRSQTSSSESAAPATPAVTTSSPRQGLGAAVLTVDVPMGSGDKYPQGALWLVPPRPGTNAYTGDISLLCSTPGKDEKVQNCTGTDKRVWSAEPLEKRATIGPATGDPFADPAACDESNGVVYGSDYVELTPGRGYCVKKDNGLVVLRVPSFPAEKPLPAKIAVEVSVLH
jgi:hypothetical protein